MNASSAIPHAPITSRLIALAMVLSLACTAVPVQAQPAAPDALPLGTLVKISGFTNWSGSNGFPVQMKYLDNTDVALTTDDAYCVAHSVSFPATADQYLVVAGETLVTDTTTREKIARVLAAAQDPMVTGRARSALDVGFAIQYAIWHYTDPLSGCNPSNPGTYGTLCAYIVNKVDAAVYPLSDVTWFQHNVGSNRHQPLAGADVAPLLGLGNFIWLETDNDGIWDTGEAGKNGVTVELYRDTDNDGVLSAGDTLVQTTVTADLPDTVGAPAQPGYYYFPALPAGNYFVKIPASQFQTNAPLAGYTSSTPAWSGDSDLNNRDHGYVVGSGPTTYVASSLITLALNSEPVIAVDTDSPNGNATIDFSFVAGVLAVDLAGFTAAQQADGVLLSWETASELDVAGFALWRGPTPAGPDTRLTGQLIPVQAAGSTAAHAYTWRDTRDLAAGVSYYYWLDAHHLDGTVDRAGPVTVTFEGGVPNAVSVRGLAATRQPGAGWLLALAAAVGVILWRRRREAPAVAPARGKAE